MTAQLPDRIILQGQSWDLYSNPLEQYWSRLHKTRPPLYPLPYCMRGYVASWQIKDHQLFLTDVDGNYEKKSIFFGTRSARFGINTLWPRFNGQPMKAAWYSGKLRVPQGKMTLYDFKGYNSRFEKEVIITIENGDLLKRVTLDYTQKSVLVNETIHVSSQKGGHGKAVR